jgi:carboxypeptidase D
MLLFTLLSSEWRWKQVIRVFVAASLFISLPVSADKTQADYFVSSLPGAPEGVPLEKMFAG